MFVGKLPPAGEITQRYNVVADAPYRFQWAELGAGWAANTEMEQQLLWPNVKYKSMGEWHHKKHSMSIARNKQNHTGEDPCNFQQLTVKLKQRKKKKKKTPQHVVNKSHRSADRGGRG